MGSFSKRAIVMVTFPFSDLSASKLRPALVLAAVASDDYVLCQITSRAYADPRAIKIESVDFDEGGLQRESYVRPEKLFTANQALIRLTVGVLGSVKYASIVRGVVGILTEGLDRV